MVIYILKIMIQTLVAFGFGLVAFAAACVRAKLSTITATNKLHNTHKKGRGTQSTTVVLVSHILDEYECL